jgi:citrate lyase beta subunit
VGVRIHDPAHPGAKTSTSWCRQPAPGLAYVVVPKVTDVVEVAA